MKILCLHGNGTNSHIMRLQTAPLRHELEDTHEYEFVEAAVEAPMSEGVGELSLPDSSFYAFYNPEDLVTSMRRSLDELHAYVLAEGPFEAIMGFSGGAFLAAMYLAEHQGAKDVGGTDTANAFKCGIFLSSASTNAELKALGATQTVGDGPVIDIPTAHIWGSNDSTCPTGGEDLSQICSRTQCQILVHDGGHELPRGDFLMKAVHLIRRTIDLAEDA